ncbi:MAG: glycosyltransferase family 2 protein [Betaproteobacteria bacterium]
MIPTFSVIVRTYNRPEFLSRCLASLAAQTRRDFEVVLVNDGGTDVALPPDLPIVYVKHDRNLGRPFALNSGLRAAQGKYITFLDDDDTCLPNHLETLAAYLDSGHMAVYPDAYTVIDGQRHLTWAQDYYQPLLYFDNWIPFSGFAMQREVYETVGEADTSLAYCEDWDYFIRISERFEITHIPQATIECHQHSGRSVNDAAALARFRRRVIRKHWRKVLLNLSPWKLPHHPRRYRGLVVAAREREKRSQE